MPTLHTYNFPVFLDAIPWDLPRPYAVLTRPGMKAASVLFSAAQWGPITIRTIASAPNEATAKIYADKFLALATKRVNVNDGVVSLRSAVVLRVTSQISDAGMICGGNAVGDRWEIATAWTILPDADLDSRA